LSLRDFEDVLATRDIIVSYEAIRKWLANLVQCMLLPSGWIGLRRLINGTLMKGSVANSSLTGDQ